MFIAGERPDGTLLVTLGEGHAVLLNLSTKCSSAPLDSKRASDQYGPWTPADNSFERRRAVRLALAVSRTVAEQTFHLAPLDAEGRRQAALKAWDVRGRKEEEKAAFAAKGEAPPAGATQRAREAAAKSRLRRVLEGVPNPEKGDVPFKQIDQIWDKDKKAWVSIPEKYAGEAGPRPATEDFLSPRAKAAAEAEAAPSVKGAELVEPTDSDGFKAADFKTPREDTPTGTKDLGGGISVSQKVSLPGRGENVWKPEIGEVDLNPHVAQNEASLAQREVLAYRIDQALGLGMVPKTEYMRLSDKDATIQTMRGMDRADAQERANAGKLVPGLGSVQHFAPSDGTGMPDDVNPNQADVAKMAILDVLIANTDRHNGNYLHKGDRLIAIDHGYTFGDYHMPTRLGSDAINAITSNKSLSKTAMSKLADRLEKLNLNDVLRGSTLPKRERDALKQRAGYLVKRLREGQLMHLDRDPKTVRSYE